MTGIIRKTIAAGSAALAVVREYGSQLFSIRSFKIATLVAVVAMLSVFAPHALTAAPLAFAIGDTSRADIANLASTEVIDTFKEVYLDALDAIPDAMPLTAQMAKTRKVEGAADSLTFNVKLRNGGAVANVGDGQKLPRPSRPMRKKGKAGLAHTYTVIAVGGQSVPLTKKARNAFVSNLEEQFEDGMERVKFDLERQYNGDGRGILCVLETVGGAPTYGAQKPYGYTYTQADVAGVQLLNEDADVAFVDPGTGLERDRSKIVSIDWDNDTFTLAASIAGGAIGDYVVLCNDNAATGSDKSINYNNEASGIGAVIGSAGDTFEDIVSTVSRRWQTVDIDKAGAAAAEKDFATMDARQAARSGQKPELYYTTRGIAIGLMDTLSSRVRYNGETLELKGGYTAVKINGRVVLEGDWCPKGHIYGLNFNKKNVATVDVVKMGYVDLDGSKLHRIEGRHAWRSDLWFPHNALWFLRAAQSRMKNVLDDLTILR